ncbi:uncharacterized protein LOC108915589 [Anoplophora glabripennis]|uniref:uncharacterized protein LOC108915589 n=1 Tax=Anoplophora glabripennis TaxID=217634 RepID=UPI0008758FF1|nr:uncharacterized protein LOC108915589 [Anoplophora glabripennis]
MKLSQVRHLALRLTLAQNVQITTKSKDRLVFPTAFLLAGLGVGVSSFSLKQLLSAKRMK